MSGETGKTALIIGASVAGAYFGGALFAGSQLAVGLGWMAGGMVGQMLFPPKSKSHNMPQMAEYPVQGSSRGMPVPLVYGTRKVAGNIVWLGDLQSYIIKHKQSGGKGGGGSGGSTTETRYRRSFLLALCEGPANVTRMWEGKKEISIEYASFFVGLNNTGISAVTGEDYGEYTNVLCAYFDSHELGNSQQIPNFTFEVQAGSINFFTGADIIGISSYTVAKCRPAGDLDDTFNEDGVFKIERSPAAGTQAIHESEIDGSVYVVQGHPDIIDGWYAASFTTAVGVVTIGDTVIGSIGGGSFLVEDIYYRPATTTGLVWLKHISGPIGVANEVYDDGGGNTFKIPNFANADWKFIAKLDENGNRVKSWGENGYKWISASIVQWVIEDKNGNLYSGISVGAGLATIFSLDSDGKIRWIQAYDPATRTYPLQSYSAVLSEDHEHIYIAGPITGLGGVNSPTTSYNAIKLKTSDGTYDTTWSTSGRFMQGDHYVGGVPSVHTVVRIPGTEEIVLHHQGNLINGKRYSLTKLTEAGFRDTSWGEDGNGMSGDYRWPVSSVWTYHGSLICDETKRLFAASYFIDSSGVLDNTLCYIEIYDSSGEIAYSFTIDTVARTIFCIFAWGGFVYLGGAARTEDGIQSQLHRYTFDGVHDTSFPGSDYQVGGDVYIEIGVITRSSISWNKDVDPAWTIYDILTNTRYGAGIPTTEININSFQNVANFCYRKKYFFSFLLNRTRPVKDWIDHINSHFFGFLTQTEGLYSLGVFKDEDSIVTLTRDNFLIDDTTEDEEPEPPIDVTKRDPKDTSNRIEIGWTNRDKLYNVNFVVANDHVEQRITGQTRKRVLGLDGITKETLATRLAWRYLYDGLYRFSDYSFRLGYQDRFIAPGQVVTLNDGDIVSGKKVRIVSIEESKNGQNLDVQAREDEAYLYPDIEYESATSKHSEAAAAALASPLIAFREDVANRLLYLSIVPQSADADGWYIYRSFDDVTYELVGTAGIDSVASANAHGTTDTTLPRHAAVVWKYDETLRVTLDANLAVESGTELDFFNNKKLAKIGDEIIAYKTATLISGTTYELRELIRGLFNTEPVAHVVGEEFFTLDIDFVYAYTKEDIGRTIYLKALTFAGDSIQALADVTGTAYTIQGEYQKPAPVSLIRNVGREGFEDIGAYPIDVDFYFGNRVSGWNFGGWGDMPWGQFEKDLAIKQVRVRLLKTDGAEILSELYDLFGYYADEYRVTITDADRDGNDPIDIEITAIGNLLSAARTSRIDIA